MIYRVFSILLILTLWVGSLAGAYWHTRTKWVELGRKHGVVEGRADAITEICKLATHGDDDPSAEVTLTAKTAVATLSRRGDFVEIHCK